jgi:uncharacterized protein with WD repeat
MATPSFEDIIQKIVDKKGKDIFHDKKRLKALILDYTKNEFERDRKLLSTLLDAKCVKVINEAEDLVQCKLDLAKRLEEKHNQDRQKSVDMLDILFNVLLWRWPVIRVFEGSSAPVVSISTFSSDCKFIATVAGTLGHISFWKAENEQRVCTPKGHDKAVSSVTFSPDGKLVVSGSYDNTLKLWKAENGQLVRSLEGHGKAVLSVAFNPNGKFIVSGSDDNTLKLWNAENGKLIRTFEGHNKGVLSVAFSPDGKLIASGSDDNTLKLWDTEKGQLLRTFEGHGKPVSFLAFSPNGKLIVSGSSYDNKLKLWEAERGQHIRTFGYGQIASAVSFSPDGKFIVSKSNQGADTLTIWETENGQPFRTFKGKGNSLLSVAFNQSVDS